MDRTISRKAFMLAASVALAIGVALAFGAPQQARADEGASAKLQAQAALTTQATIPYVMNTQYDGNVESHSSSYFTFTLSKRQHVWVTVLSDYDRFEVSFEDLNGNTVSGNLNTIVSKNSQSDWDYTYNHSCTLDAGSYRLRVYIYAYSTYRINMSMDSEDVITLDRSSITSLSSPAGGTLKVNASPVAGAVGYQYRLATNSNFSDATLVESPGSALTKAGLKKGANYYVAVRPYAVYSDGWSVYGSWSRVQSVYVKKLDNAVTISTSGKSFKASDLKKRNKTFNIIADDKAGAKLTYKFSSVPAKAKKYVSVSKTTGKVTVKKGLKKGSYKLAVQVTSDATSSYNKATATRQLTLTVK